MDVLEGSGDLVEALVGGFFDSGLGKGFCLEDIVVCGGVLVLCGAPIIGSVPLARLLSTSLYKVSCCSRASAVIVEGLEVEGGREMEGWEARREARCLCVCSLKW